ncbi:TPA: hypothetical protein NHK69_003936 [Pseudomonas aeruginosa]|nr:hypothetical protein [Pseudomonas aeruginosa]
MGIHYDMMVLGQVPTVTSPPFAPRLGKSVAVFEKQYWGANCLNAGTIPPKAILCKRRASPEVGSTAKQPARNVHFRSALRESVQGGVHGLCWTHSQF